MLLGECLPKNHKVPFDIVNRLLTKKDIADVIDEVYRHTGQKDTVLFADAIMGPWLPPRVQGWHLLRQG
jgi:DNA-directed RNA polymerase subunit beta'